MDNKIDKQQLKDLILNTINEEILRNIKKYDKVTTVIVNIDLDVFSLVWTPTDVKDNVLSLDIEKSVIKKTIKKHKLNLDMMSFIVMGNVARVELLDSNNTAVCNIHAKVCDEGEDIEEYTVVEDGVDTDGDIEEEMAIEENSPKKFVDDIFKSI